MEKLKREKACRLSDDFLQNVDEAFELMGRMEMEGIEADAVSFNILISGLHDAERFIEAKEVMGRMVFERVNPSSDSFKKLIHGFCKAKMVKEVDWTLKQMVCHGFVPKSGVWIPIVDCVFAGKNTCDISFLGEIIDS
ncbi:Glucan synthase-like 4 [Hibiscus syriacus]|uniref:Glucan synthase-like 4 n=1 Tax=Hibiscus syriacus TaxID=106335 RepID=A0A6A3BQL7_HIBSY|nr:Glucan synthase-like 4 [Hibiscus syriacus]